MCMLTMKSNIFEIKKSHFTNPHYLTIKFKIKTSTRTSQSISLPRYFKRSLMASRLQAVMRY